MLNELNQLFDYVAERLKEHERRQLYERAFSEKYAVIEAPLSEIHRNKQSRFFSFGVAPGWWDMDAPALNAIASHTVLAGATTVENAAFFVGDLGLAENDEEAFAVLAYPDQLFEVRERHLSRSQPTQKWGVPTRLSLDGDRSVLFWFSTQVPGHLLESLE